MSTVRAKGSKRSQGLETNLRPELHGARISKAIHLPEHGTGYIRGGEASEVRVVKEIEDLGAKLEPDTLGKPNVLRHRKVHALWSEGRR